MATPPRGAGVPVVKGVEREQPHLLEQNAQSPGGGEGRESSRGRETWGFVSTLHPSGASR